MIIKGSIRSGSRSLARHLMNASENEHIEVHELRGFASQSLVGALLEIDATSKATLAQKPLFSVSFNAPETELVSDEQYFDAFESVEDKLGLVGQPRAVVSHEKKGRRHFHVVWSRIDGEAFKAIQLPHFKLKCRDIAREQFEKNKWPIPEGYINPRMKQTVNLNTAEYAQIKRQEVDAEELKMQCMEAWSSSDNTNSFRDALEDRNLFIAKGDKRGFVLLDHNAKIYSLSRFSGIKTKDLKTKLGPPDALPSIDEAMKYIASFQTDSMRAHSDRLKQKQSTQMLVLEKAKVELIDSQKMERKEQLTQNRTTKILARRYLTRKFQSGIAAIFNEVVGGKYRIRNRWRDEFEKISASYARSRQVLIFQHNEVRAKLETKIRELKDVHRLERMDLAKKMVAIRRSEIKKLFQGVIREFERLAQRNEASYSANIYESKSKRLVKKIRTKMKISRRRGRSKNWRVRRLSRREAGFLRRKRHNLRYLKLLRREKPSQECKLKINEACHSPIPERENEKTKPFLSMRID